MPQFMKVLITAYLFFPVTAYAQELQIFGGSGHDEFLGCLTCSEFSSDSICNEFGSYGNEFSSSGMFNEFAGFGNEFSAKSPWNEFSTSNEIPVLVDKDGKFYGYFTINEYRSDAVEFSGEMKKWFDQHNGDIEKVRINLCNYFGYSG